jgi:hypothetical protein
MNFLNFIDENEGVAMSTPSIKDLNLENLNSRLYYEMDEPYLSPESGIQRIRRVLHLYGLDFPALYDLEPEGDELAVDLTDKWRIYILYYLKEDNVYDFFAEVGDENRMNELLSDVEEETEEI